MHAERRTGPADGRARQVLRAFRVSPVLLVVLVAVDLVLVVASAVVDSRGAGPGDGALALETDGGLAEYVGYVHQLVLVVLLLAVWRLSGPRVWIAWAALFAVVLADDSARVHETVGDRFADGLGLPDGVAGLRADDLGELVAWAVLTVVPLVCIVALHRRSDPGTRAASSRLAALVAAYAFFGVVVDQVHAMARDGSWAGVLGTVEDGGELVVLSLTLAHVAAVVGALRRPGLPPGGEGADQAPARSADSASSSPA